MEAIGDYDLVRLLRETATGKVYEARERFSERKVALKVLRPELSGELFASELAAVAELEHPSVLRVLSFREIDDELVLELELVEGGESLRTFLATYERLPVTRALGIIVQLTRALCEGHEHEPPIVHGALEPDNVMVQSDLTVKVMDFGIAKLLHASGTTYGARSLAFMSPEQIEGADIDERSDLYCLGLVMYELLAGAPPFESRSPRELLTLQCAAPPPPLPDDVRQVLPRGMERLLFELLEKARADRPASARDVLERLEAFSPVGQGESQPERSSRAMPDRKPKPSPASRRDVPARIAVAIVLAASLLAGLATWCVQSSGEAEPARALEPRR